MPDIKIPIYDILNRLMIGLLYILLLICLFNHEFVSAFGEHKLLMFLSKNTLISSLCFFATAYEIGTIINRLGSVIIEPLLIQKVKMPFNNDYVALNKARKSYGIIEILSREYALSRTNIALIITATPMFIMRFFMNHILINDTGWLVIYMTVLFFILWIFYKSCYKYSERINKVVNHVKKHSGEFHE